jgi:hypothetical protein
MDVEIPVLEEVKNKTVVADNYDSISKRFLRIL